MAFHITGARIVEAHSLGPGASASAKINWGGTASNSWAKPMLQYHDEFTETTLTDAFVSGFVQNGAFTGNQHLAYVSKPNLSEVDFHLNVSGSTMGRMVCEAFAWAP